MHRPLSTCLVVAAVLVLTACGGAQRGGSSGPGWTNALDAVPADAAYAMGYDLDEAFLAPGSFRTAMLGNDDLHLSEDEAAMLEALLDPASIGIDPGGDVAAFSTSMLPVGLARLTDREAFDEFVQSLLDDAGLDYLEDRTYAGVTFEVYGDPDDLDDPVVELGYVGAYAVARMRVPEPLWANVSDDDFIAWLSGGEGPHFVDSRRFEEARDRLPEIGSLTQFYTLDMARVADIVERIMTHLDDDDRALGLGEDSAYESPQQQSACAAATARFVADLPYFVGASTQHGTTVRDLRGTFIVGLSEALHGRLAPALQPTSSFLADASADAIFYMESGIELAPLMDAIVADPDLTSCPGIIAGVAQLAEARDDVRDDVDQFTERATLAGALALFGVELGGMVPLVDVAASVSSPDAVSLAAEVERMLRAQGATPSVDETAPYSTIEYNLFITTLRVMQMPDRLVLSMGDVPPAAMTALTERERSGSTFLRAGLNGPRLAALLRSVAGYARDAGAGDLGGVMDSALEIYDRMGTVQMVGQLEPGRIAFDSAVEMTVDE